jgi:hypothetical protein
VTANDPLPAAAGQTPEPTPADFICGVTKSLSDDAKKELRDYGVWLTLEKPRPDFHAWRRLPRDPAAALPEGKPAPTPATEAVNCDGYNSGECEDWCAGCGVRPSDEGAEEPAPILVSEYAAAARVIHLHLGEFCDETKAYPEMVADAARKAAAAIAELRATPRVSSGGETPSDLRPLIVELEVALRDQVNRGERFARQVRPLLQRARDASHTILPTAAELRASLSSSVEPRASVEEPPRRTFSEGELWLFARRCVEAGIDLAADFAPAEGYEMRSARIDVRARELADSSAPRSVGEATSEPLRCVHGRMVCEPCIAERVLADRAAAPLSETPAPAADDGQRRENAPRSTAGAALPVPSETPKSPSEAPQ